MSLWDSIRDAFNRANNRNSGSSGGSSGSSSGSGSRTGSAIGGLIGGLIGGPTGANAGRLIGGAIGATAGGHSEPLTTTTPTDPATDYINELKEAQRRARIAALDTAKSNALAALEQERANVEPVYYDKRNQAAAQSDINAMNFANYMASRGIKGPAGAMPEIYRQAGLQGQIGALDAAEARDLANIERQRGLIESNYQFDVAQANADVESQAMQQLIDQWNRNREYNLSLGQLTGVINGTPTLQSRQMETEATGYYNPWAVYALNDDIREQLSPYMDNLQAFIDANPDSPLVPYAQNLRFQKIMSDPTLQEKYGQQYQTVAGRNAALQAKQMELENIAREIENSYLPQTLKLEAQRLAQEVKAGSLDYDIALAQLNQIKKQTALMGTSRGGSGGSGNKPSSYNSLTKNQEFNFINESIADLNAAVSDGTVKSREEALAKFAPYRSYLSTDAQRAIDAEINRLFPEKVAPGGVDPFWYVPSVLR